MATKFFPETLKAVLHQLDLSQAKLAAASKLSPSMIVKLVAGDDAHRNTYKKVFDYFRKNYPEEAKRLMEAYLMDIAAQVGLNDTYKPSVKLSSKKESAILHMFGTMPPTILKALHAVGHAAQEKDTVLNALLTLAEITNEIPDTQIGSPEGFFSSSLAIPRKSSPQWMLRGGSLGDLDVALSE